MPRETIGNTLAVAAGVCVVCSLVVSTAAVGLRPFQEANKILDQRRNILVAAGLLEPGEKADVDALFERIEARVVDLRTGEFAPDVSPDALDVRRAARDPRQSTPLSTAEDMASIKRKPNYQTIYLLRDGENIRRVILPVYGLGLWSTMYGFVALDADMTTIESLSFYEHGETPGLGGEIDNPRWQEKWIGKKAYDEQGNPAIEVVKGGVREGDPNAIHEVDAISGATMTSRGVENLLNFWLGDQGYGPLLAKLKT
jgi:Na+-transporting NADH:ubiquinone oxidoreductase subunit C